MPPVAGDNVDIVKDFLEGAISSEEAPKATAVPVSMALVPLDERAEEQQRPAIKDLHQPPLKPLPLVPTDEKPPPPPPPPKPPPAGTTPRRHPPVPPGGLRPNRPPPKPAEQTPKVPPEPEKPHKVSEKHGNDPALYAMMNNEVHREVECKRQLIPRRLFLANLLACFILVVISHIIIVYDFERRASMTSPPVPSAIGEDDHVCRDVQCSAAGTHLFYVLNASVKPCDSIYDYVCKSWIHEGPQNYRKIVLGSERIFVDNMYTEMKTALLSYQARASESEAVRKATELYRLCLEEPKKQPKNTNLINQLLSDYGLSSWPYSESAATNFFSSPYLSLAKFIRDSGVGAVVAVKMLPDPENTLARVFALDCSTFIVPMGTLLQFAEHKSDTLLGYKAYIADVLKAVRPRRQDVDKLATTIMAFEVNMAHRCSEGCRKKRFKRTTLNDLTSELKSKGVDWKQFLEAVAPVKSDIRQSTPVLVRSLRYLKGVSMLFEDQQTLRRMMNYVGWRAVHHFMRHAGTSFRELTEAFMTARLKEERFPYDRSCIRDVNDVMPFAVGRVFAETVFSQDHFDFAARSVNALMKGFQVVLKEFQWAPLDVQTKFSRMDYIVSYPEWIKNFSRLNAYYDSVPTSGSYFNRYISASRNRYQRYLSPPPMMPYMHRRLAEFIFPSRVVDLERRVGPPRETTFYDVRDNTLIVPAGAMQPPYFDTRRPWGLTFGGLGTMVSRDFVNEMFHTPEGILKDDKQKTIFKDKTQCLLDYIKKGLDPNTNPDCTSIVTDVFALRVAYEAYQIFVDGRDDDTLQGVAQMTPDQLFFISAVRTLCTSIREQHFSQVVLLRKNVTEMDLIDPAVMSMREFEDAFNCKQSNGRIGRELVQQVFLPSSSIMTAVTATGQASVEMNLRKRTLLRPNENADSETA
nr:neprilysin-1-like [Rhipicephalus microplus]